MRERILRVFFAVLAIALLVATYERADEAAQRLAAAALPADRSALMYRAEYDDVDGVHRIVETRARGGEPEEVTLERHSLDLLRLLKRHPNRSKP